MAPDRPALEDLLQHGPWLRRLAYRLVKDEDVAEDALQEMWIMAWQKPPRCGEAGASWLRTVLVNTLRGGYRAEARRKAREASALTSESPSAEDLVVDGEVQRLLAQRVEALSAPYRKVVLLRYEEGLDSFQIAERLRLPAGTVRRRLKTALDRLRREMDGDGPQGSRLRALLIPLPLRAPASGSVRPKTIFLGMLLPAAVALFALVAWRHQSTPQASARLMEKAEDPHGVGGPVHAAPYWLALEARGLFSSTSANETVQNSGDSAILEGRVISSSGLPLAGAAVTVEQDTCRVWMQADRVVTTTDDEGRFHLTLPKGQYWVQAEEIGYAPTREFLHFNRPLQTEIRLAPFQRIVGVIDPPLADANVWAVNGKGRIAAEGRTDAGGGFELALSEGEHKIYARHASLAGAATVHVAAGVATSARIALIEGVTVVGRVSEGQVPRAHVPVSFEAPGAPRFDTITDASGGFRMGGLFPGPYHVRAESAECEADLAIEVEADGTSVDLQLLPRHQLFGRVVTAKGEPVVGAEVVMQKMGQASRLTAITNAEGHFTFSEPQAGKLALVARHPDFGIALVQDGEDEVVSSPSPMVLTLQPSASVAGVVQFNDGAPAAGVRVHALIEPAGSALGFTGSSMSDEDGRFVVAGLGPGRGYLTAAWSSPPAAIRGFDELGFPYRKLLHLSPGEQQEHVVLVVPRPGLPIRGVVLDFGGQPISGAVVDLKLQDVRGNVVADEAVVTTDGSGRFAMERPSQGIHSVRATLDGHEPAMATSIPDGVEVSLRMLPAP